MLLVFYTALLIVAGAFASDTEVASRKLLDQKAAAEYVGLSIKQDKSIITLGAKEDIKIWRNGQSKLKVQADSVDFVSSSVTVNGKADFDYVPLSHNLISNSFMSHLSGKKPAGFRVSTYNCQGCKMTLEAVSAFTKCFEGPYCPADKAKKCSNYPNSVSKCNDATAKKPYIFGTYYKGPRAGRGGLADGWAGGGGRILKITGVRPKGAKYVIRINFPIEKKTLTNRVLFRGFLKIIKGSASLQTDVSVRPIWTRAVTEKAPDGWYQINRKISGSHVTDLDGSHTFTFCAYGEESGNFGTFEMYLALPYITNILEKTKDHDKDGTTHIARWQDSVMDQIIEHGMARWENDKIHSVAQDDFDYVPLAHNLISNSYMSHLNGNKPAGFRTSAYACSGCKITIQAVSAFTKCFEGPYCPAKNKKCSNYPKAVSKCDDATGSRPYIFGTYYKGPRAGRGGLQDGWAGGGGRILKITGVRPKGAKYVIRVNFPIERRTLTNQVLFRGFLKITKGGASLQTDVGPRPIWTRAMTEKAQDGWYQINRKISGSHVTDLDGSHTFTFCAYGEESGNHGNFEMYLALPYIANVLDKIKGVNSDNNAHIARWQDSVMDQVVYHGVAKWTGDNMGPTRRRLGEEDFEVATLREQVSVLQKQNKEQMKQLDDLRSEVAKIALNQNQ